MHQHAKFRQNWLIGCEDIKIFRFFKMAAVRHLNSFETYLDHLLKVSITLQSYDRCSSFYNVNISIFGAFGWKMPIHAPKIEVFGQFDHLNWLQYQPKPKGTPLCMSASFEPLSVKMW